MAVPAAKFHVPVPRRELVPRPRLTAQLRGDRGSTPRLVLVSAPAGSGKTVALSQWFADPTVGGPRVAWLSLDPDDGDPVRFLGHLVDALRTGVDGRLGATAGPPTTADRPPSPDVVLTGLVDDLARLAGPAVLVLDDYHVVDVPAVHRCTAFLVEHLPPHITLAIATRADPPLPLARLRSRGELVELRAADLRFTLAEATEFLEALLGPGLDRRHVAALTERTEGWAAGLQLAALSLRGHEDVADFVEGFAGSHRFVLDYLVEEVLDGLADDVRDFLLDTCILREVTGPLCDALTGREDGQQTLEALDRDNLFVVPLDDRRTWYRYHHLFAEALHARLRARRPRRLPELHRAAAGWHAANGTLADAVRHALAGDDHRRAAELVEAAVPDLRRRRQDQTIRTWLAALPEAVVRRSPLLSTTFAWTRLSEGDLDGVGAWLDRAEAALAVTRPRTSDPAEAARDAEVRALPATIAMYRAAVAQARGDLPGTIAQARRGLELADAHDHGARAGAGGFLALATWTSGDPVAAVDAFGEAIASMRASGNTTDALGATVVLADMWLTRGRPTEARRLLERALETARQHPGPALSITGDLHVALAHVLRERADLEAAEEHLRVGERLGDAASLPENRHRRLVALAGLRQARGDLDGAVRMLEQAETLRLPGYFPELRPLTAAVARLRIAQGRLDEARGWARAHGVAPLDRASFAAEFDQLTLARLLIAETRTDAALGLLDRYLDDARTTARGGSVVEVLLLRALAHRARGDLDRALPDLARALDLGVPAGYARLYLDEGPPVLELLDVLAGRPEGALARQLRGAPAAARPEHGLSDREVEVVKLLATDLTGPEIARRLFVSVNTLRTHTKHIFTKLDVTSRRAAVRRALDLDLL